MGYLLRHDCPRVLGCLHQESADFNCPRSQSQTTLVAVRCSNEGVDLSTRDLQRRAHPPSNPLRGDVTVLQAIEEPVSGFTSVAPYGVEEILVVEDLHHGLYF